MKTLIDVRLPYVEPGLGSVYVEPGLQTRRVLYVEPGLQARRVVSPLEH
jgi:hypothetical protein